MKKKTQNNNAIIKEQIVMWSMPSDDISQKIMTERARILAKPRVEMKSTNTLQDSYIKLRLGNDEYYGIPYYALDKIEYASSITTVPRVPHFVAGVYYWHGKIIPVIDLSLFFGIHEKHSTKDIYIATVSSGEMILGLIFSDVVGIDEFNIKELDHQITGYSKMKDHHVMGIHRGRVCILNVERIAMDITKALREYKGI